MKETKAEVKEESQPPVIDVEDQSEPQATQTNKIAVLVEIDGNLAMIKGKIDIKD